MPCEGVSWHFGSLIGMGLQAGRAGEALLPDRDAPCLISDGPLRHFGRPTCLLGFSKKVLQTSFNYCCSVISLLQLENRMFVLLELLKPTNLSPWVGFKAVLADVAPCQLSYVAPRQP